ncbi:MAG: acyl carrier protein [Thermoguttaceae bacterium]|nr:acyl carrier protein [Thermoguttaceae bacterium]MBR4751986.1 acyl carrier protein [Thermoguttaceae bacterium]MBR5760354.1 acyl carrier protein [Thermoguttaceae bacterium]
MMDTFQLVSLAIAKRLGISASEITMETELMELGIDSLDAAELLMDLEEKLGVEVEATRKLKTIKDVVAEIEAAVNE